MATLRTFQWGALAVGIGFCCSVNPAGLPADGGSGGAVSGSGGASATADGPASGGAVGSGGETLPSSGGRSGAGTGGVGESGGAQGTGGPAGSGGIEAASGGSSVSGGAVGSGGLQASGGMPGSGGAQTGGSPATGGRGTGGAATGGAATGGAPGSGGAGTGGAGTGGAGTGGHTASGGRMGNCNRFPDATAFTPPDDDRVHCYWYRPDMRTWQAARTDCMKETGADLVTIRSAEENEFVRKVARFTNSPPESWIGATDDRAGNNTTGPGTYHWTVAGEAWSYTNWNQATPKQPDGYCDPCDNGQPCTCDHRGTLAANGTWYDFWQDNPRGYVCEALAPSE